MPEQKPDPIDQAELERRLKAGESLEGIEIGDVDFSHQTFGYFVNFDGAVFVGKFRFERTQFSNGASFREAQFIGIEKVVFFCSVFAGNKGVDFYGAIFEGCREVSFWGVKFGGKKGTLFSDSRFIGSEEVEFSEAEFKGRRTIFSGAIFDTEKGVNFFNSKFYGEEILFRETKFTGKGKVSFPCCHFGVSKEISFESAKFDMENSLDFNWSEFAGEGKLIFDKTVFLLNHIVEINYVTFKNASTALFQDVCLGKFSFFQTDVEDFIFKNVEFNKVGKLFWERQYLLNEFLHSKKNRKGRIS